MTFEHEFATFVITMIVGSLLVAAFDFYVVQPRRRKRHQSGS
jgi:hypothetical protein